MTLSRDRAKPHLLVRVQPVIPPNLYVYEHNSMGSPGKAALLPVITTIRNIKTHSASLNLFSLLGMSSRCFLRTHISAVLISISATWVRVSAKVKDTFTVFSV